MQYTINSLYSYTSAFTSALRLSIDAFSDTFDAHINMIELVKV